MPVLILMLWLTLARLMTRPAGLTINGRIGRDRDDGAWRADTVLYLEIVGTTQWRLIAGRAWNGGIDQMELIGRMPYRSAI